MRFLGAPPWTLFLRVLRPGPCSCGCFAPDPGRGEPKLGSPGPPPAKHAFPMIVPPDHSLCTVGGAWYARMCGVVNNGNGNDGDDVGDGDDVVEAEGLVDDRENVV